MLSQNIFIQNLLMFLIKWGMRRNLILFFFTPLAVIIKIIYIYRLRF